VVYAHEGYDFVVYLADEFIFILHSKDDENDNERWIWDILIYDTKPSIVLLEYNLCGKNGNKSFKIKVSNFKIFKIDLPIPIIEDMSGNKNILLYLSNISTNLVHLCSMQRALPLKAYRYRIYPTDAQVAFFAKTFGCCRFVWNKMLDKKIQDYKKKELIPQDIPAKYKVEQLN